MKDANEANDVTMTQVNEEWDSMLKEWKDDTAKLRERLGVNDETTVDALMDTEDKLRTAWNSSCAGFKLSGFKVEIGETITKYPLNAWLMFTPDNKEEGSWELATRFGGVSSEIIDWLHETVGVDTGVQLELKLPMTHAK